MSLRLMPVPVERRLAFEDGVVVDHGDPVLSRWCRARDKGAGADGSVVGVDDAAVARSKDVLARCLDEVQRGAAFLQRRPVVSLVADKDGVVVW